MVLYFSEKFIKLEKQKYDRYINRIEKDAKAKANSMMDGL